MGFSRKWKDFLSSHNMPDTLCEGWSCTKGHEQEQPIYCGDGKEGQLWAVDWARGLASFFAPPLSCTSHTGWTTVPNQLLYGRHCVPKRKKKKKKETNSILSYPLTLKQVIEQLANKHFLIKLSSVSEMIWGLTKDSLCAKIMQGWTCRQRKTILQSQVSHKVAKLVQMHRVVTYILRYEL